MPFGGDEDTKGSGCPIFKNDLHTFSFVFYRFDTSYGCLHADRFSYGCLLASLRLFLHERRYVKGAKPMPFGGDEDTKGNGCPDNQVSYVLLLYLFYYSQA